MAEVLRGQCISTGVTTVADIRKLTKVTALHRCNEVCLQHGVDIMRLHRKSPQVGIFFSGRT